MGLLDIFFLRMTKCCNAIQVDFTSLNIVSHTILTHLTDCFRQSHCPQQKQEETWIRTSLVSGPC